MENNDIFWHKKYIPYLYMHGHLEANKYQQEAPPISLNCASPYWNLQGISKHLDP
jgi:hypothetical protein